jgi:excinuclease ABC subunit B
VGILDADKEGFLRSETSLVQTIGRAARNSAANVVLYADRVTGSMQRAMDETDRRRAIQVAHNEANGITPTTVARGVIDMVRDEVAEDQDAFRHGQHKNKFGKHGKPTRGLLEEAREKFGDNMSAVLADLEKRMFEAAENLEFELAADIRDQIKDLQEN